MAASKLHKRSADALEEAGWVVDTVERRISRFLGKHDDGTPKWGRGQTVDLWGWCDIVAFDPNHKRLAFVQVCAASDAAPHRRKIEGWEAMAPFLSLPFRHHVKVHLHLWRKPKKGVRRRYELSVQELDLKAVSDPDDPSKDFQWRPTNL